MFTKFLIEKMDRKSQQHRPQLQQQQQPHTQLMPKSKLAVQERSTMLAETSASKGRRQTAGGETNNATTAATRVAASKSVPRNNNININNNNNYAAVAAGEAAAASTSNLPRASQTLGNRYYGGGGRTKSLITTTTTGAAAARANANANASPNVTVLSQMQVQRANDLSDKLARMTRRNAMKELGVMQARSIQMQDKNAEALRELQENIPEIGKIFDVHCRIGSGTFSTVLLGTLQRERPITEVQRRRFAIKHHNPTNHPERILRELECMYKIGGVDNVIGIHCCIRYNENVAFVMPYMSHDRFHDIYRHLSLAEVRDYVRNLLVALRHVHKFNVIHRDVKPSNILYNRRTRQFLLCDFGLAQRIASDGSIIQATDLSAAAAAALLRDMEAARQLMLHGGSGAPGYQTSCQAETDAYLALTRDQESMRRMRALGGGGGVDRPLDNVLPFSSPALDQRKLQSLANLSRREQAAQKADTLRLINRLRYMATNTDPNNYVVSTNTARKEMHASRAGTPGYRPPEVLLRYPQQTTAVDVWAAGVILLSLLSSLHPFFKAPNDCAALSEIMNLLGDLAVRKTAFMLDRLVLLTQKVNPLDLRRVCMRFRYADIFLSPEVQRRHRRPDGSTDICRNCEQATYNCLCKHTSHRTEPYEGLDVFPMAAYDLLNRLLEVNPQKRITAEEALKHPFFSEHHRLVAGVPVQQLASNPQLQQRPRETLVAAAARTMKPYMSYPLAVKSTTDATAGGGSTGNGQASNNTPSTNI